MGTETPPTQRIGPALAIVGTCEGCEHLRPSTVGGHRLGFVDCAHPLKPVPFIGNVNTSITTPADCPEQGPARLALGRALVAESDVSAEQVEAPAVCVCGHRKSSHGGATNLGGCRASIRAYGERGCPCSRFLDVKSRKGIAALAEQAERARRNIAADDECSAPHGAQEGSDK